MAKKRGSSKKYQYKIVEVSFDQLQLNNFSNERSIGNILTERRMNEDIISLREKLLEEVYGIIFGSDITNHQRNILLMRLDGKTQNEIAEHLGITQSAVHKALHGNIDYKNDKKRYGGVYKKLKKKCLNNENIQNILLKISEIRSTT